MNSEKRSRDQYHRYDDGYERNVRRVMHDDRQHYHHVRFNETPTHPPPQGYQYSSHPNFTSSGSTTTSVSSLSHYGPPPSSYRRSD